MNVELEGPGVTIADVVAVARENVEVHLTDGAVDRMDDRRRIVERLAEGEPKYGISTGFGALATVSIPMSVEPICKQRSYGRTLREWDQPSRMRSFEP